MTPQIGEKYRFEYPLGFSEPDYCAHRGQVVTVMRLATEDERDGPEVDEAQFWVIRAEDGWEGLADADELTATSSTAEQLIGAAGQSPEMESWISLQLKAGQKPSQILAELSLAQPLFDRACNALASGSVRVAAAMSLTFALTVISLAVGVH